jgi:hypothetical protein
LKSAGDWMLTSNSMMSWPMPHSSAHWPWITWSAQLASTDRSNSLTWPGTTSRLKRNDGHVERVDHVVARQEEVRRLARRQVQAVGAWGTATEKTGSSVGPAPGAM